MLSNFEIFRFEKFREVNVVLVLVDDTFKNVEFMHCKSLCNVFEKYYNTRNLHVWLQNVFFS